jgi:hypothetical protein
MSANPPGGRGLDSRAAAASDHDLLQVMGPGLLSRAVASIVAKFYYFTQQVEPFLSRISLQTLRRGVLYFSLQRSFRQYIVPDVVHPVRRTLLI